MSLKDKIEKICKEMYGADGVDYSELAESRLAVSLPAADCPLKNMHPNFYYLLPDSSEFPIFLTTFLCFILFRPTPQQAMAHSPSAWRRLSTLSVLMPPRRASQLVSELLSATSVLPLEQATSTPSAPIS